MADGMGMAAVVPYNFVVYEVWAWYNQINKSVDLLRRATGRTVT